ncbi:hypothetical protein SESBI_07123 [Sesbania bispinosa]|nr:hypothetical protein SESBI_07123 [Sesbania bispinosa]
MRIQGIQISAMEVQGQREEEAATLVDVSVLNVQGERQEGDCIVSDVSLAEEDVYSSDESVKGVYFDDSEEERDMGDDGFNLPDVGAAEATLNEELQKMKELNALTQEDDMFGPQVKRKKRSGTRSRRNHPVIDESGPSHNIDEEVDGATNGSF